MDQSPFYFRDVVFFSRYFSFLCMSFCRVYIRIERIQGEFGLKRVMKLMSSQSDQEEVKLQSCL